MNIFSKIKYMGIFIFKDVPRIANQKSYYEELPRKSKSKRLKDLYWWLFKYKEPNEFYNLYGQDIKGHNQKADNILANSTFRHQRDRLNNVRKMPYNYLSLLRDKFVFSSYLESCQIPVVKNFAVVINGKIEKTDNLLSYDEILKYKEGKQFFVKVVDGECGDGVFKITVKNGQFYDKNDEIVRLDTLLKESVAIFQEELTQHRIMNLLNPNCINTLRIITCYTKDGVQVLSSILRVGTTTLNMDNWATGGVIVGIENDGKLKKYGYYKPSKGAKKISKHPLTNTAFEGFEIPCYQEALELVKNAHRYFYDIFAIGWDVAITDKGPVLIEGNDNFEISLNQTVDCPLKDKWEEFAKNHSKMKMRF